MNRFKREAIAFRRCFKIHGDNHNHEKKLMWAALLVWGVIAVGVAFGMAEQTQTFEQITTVVVGHLPGTRHNATWLIDVVASGFAHFSFSRCSAYKEWVGSWRVASGSAWTRKFTNRRKQPLATPQIAQGDALLAVLRLP